MTKMIYLHKVTDMETWQVDLLKIGLTAVVFFLIGLGSHWYRSRTRFKEYLKKREIEQVPEREHIQEIDKLTTVLIKYKEHNITPEEYLEFKEKILSQAYEGESKVRSTGEIIKTKEEFLRRAYAIRARARAILSLAHVFQIAIREHRLYEEKDEIEGENYDEKTCNTLKKILDNGLKTLLPIYLVNGKGGKPKPLPWKAIEEKVVLLNRIIELRQKVEKGEIELPERSEINELFDKVGDALGDIFVGLIAIGSQSIISEYRVHKFIEELEKKAELD
ncbi:hypothetical protein ES703_74813 [subsurface metagenome]